MATIRLVPSTYAVSSASYLNVSNAENMYTNTDSTTYATITNTNASTSSRYLYLRGFNFDDIPSGATINSFTVKIKGYESGLNTSTSYAPRLANGTSALSNTTASTNFGTSTKTITIPTGSLTWQQISSTYGSNFTIMVYVRRNNRNTTGYFYCYGAEIEVNYTASNVPVTGVSVSPTTATIETGSTQQLTATVAPSTATNQNVTWSSSNTSVATVSSTGLVTGVSTGSATITATTADGGYTATCTVTVTVAVTYDYKLATSLVPGKSYLIVNGNTGSVYMMSNEAGGSRQLKGISATVSNNKITINSSTKAKVAFDCVLYDSGNDITTCLMNNNQYIYSDSSTGLRMYTSSTMNRFWHYVDDKFWLFKSTTTNGYTDTSSEYKYYLSCDSSGNFTDNHLTSPSIQNTTLPAMYIYVEDDGGSTESIYIKKNGSWVQCSKVYKKVNGSWVEQDSSTWTTIMPTNGNYQLIQL